jgi:hypothetical protein
MKFVPHVEEIIAEDSCSESKASPPVPLKGRLRAKKFFLYNFSEKITLKFIGDLQYVE